jgi:1-acyl-sn-glycerol-3-phosphate acyltransferase
MPEVASARNLTASLIRLACGVRLIPPSSLPGPPFVIFANHSSHLDFATIWAALPSGARAFVRPVAGRDYWEKTALRRWLATRVFNAVLIERNRVTVANNPLEPMLAALAQGASLIVFPEGTRGADGAIQPFKGGLFHLAQSRPETPFVPVLLDNLNRILPKGEFLAVPLIATIAEGPPLHINPGETKVDFLARARQALETLRSH